MPVLQAARSLFRNQFIQAAVFVLALWLIYQLRLLVFILLFSFIVMSGIRPLADYLRQRGWPKLLAILLPYIVLIFAIALIAYLFIPALVGQFAMFAVGLPGYLESASAFLARLGIPSQDLATGLSAIFSTFSSSLSVVPQTIFSIAVAIVTIAVVSIYFLWDTDYVAWVIGFLNSRKRDLMQRLESAMGNWIRGQLILCAIVGVASWIGLAALGVDYALLLGAIAGLLEFIPFAGPIISSIIAMIVAAKISLFQVLLVALLFFVIQQLESNLLTPQIMKRSTSLHPISVIVSIFIGAEFLGIIGAIAAVPLVTVVKIIVNQIRQEEAERTT